MARNRNARTETGAAAQPVGGGAAFTVPAGVKHLDVIQLNELTRAFAAWNNEASTPAARRSRGRMWLVFLLLRYTGAKLGEVLALDESTDIDLDRRIARLNAGGEVREVELAGEAVDELRRYLDAPGVAELRGRVFRLDQAQVRRKFQEMGEAAGLPRELANPATLRRSRAIELLRGGVPLQVVQGLLGHGTAGLTATFTDFPEAEREKIVRRYLELEEKRATSARNSFFGKITAIRRGDVQAEIELTTLEGQRVSAIITSASLRNLNLVEGMLATAIVKAPLVILGRGDSPPPVSAENRLLGRLESLQIGRIMAEAVVRVSPTLTVCAILTSRSARELALRTGEPAWAMFDAQAVILTLN